MKYVFDKTVLDSDARELRGAEGPIAVEPKVFDVLLHLIENRDRVVGKDELVETVWDGRFVSDAAVSSCISAARRAMGDDGRSQRYLKTAHGRGFRFVAEVVESDAGSEVDLDQLAGTPAQEIRFCQSADGTRLAYAVAGSGPPLVKTANWLNHLEFDWESPVWHHFFRELTSRHRLVRYDARGNGLSSWDVDDFSFGRHVEDLEAVVDHLGLETFPLIAISQGCARSVGYAARHPERVRKMVLLGGYARGWRQRGADEGHALRSSANELMKTWWGKENPMVRQMMASMYMPDAPPESQSWFCDLQRKTTSSENAAKIFFDAGEDLVTDLLSQIRCPTLVIHARNESGVPYEEGKILASGIPGAQFATLETSNHILPETDPAWYRCARLIRDFLAD